LDDPLSYLGVLVVAACLAGSFYFSLSEAALLAVSAVTVRRRAASGDSRAQIIDQLRGSGDYLTALIIGFNACNLSIATIMTLLLRRAGADGELLHQDLAHLMMIAIIVILAEITPKTYGSLFAEQVALRVAHNIERFTRLLGPIVAMLGGISKLLFKSADPGLARRQELITTAEIQAAIDASEEEGMVPPDEGKMFDRVLELGQTTVKEIMVPRVDIVALPDNADLTQMTETAMQSGFSRIPVYEDDIDQITGVLYVNDLLGACAEGRKVLQAAELARPPLYVPETKRVDQLFGQMRSQATHLAIVVDEFGGTEGLVAIEDILEELVGEIEDEHDVPHQGIIVLGPAEALAEGKTSLEEINELLGLQLPEDEYETIAGLVSGLAGRIPAPGDVMTYNGIQLIVEQGDRQHIEQIRIVTEAKEGE